MAKQRALPVILHIVRAHAMAIDILKESGLPNSGGMVHSFSGSPADAQAYTALGLHISFSGNITHPNAKKTRRAAAVVPAQQLLVETDSPDQPPYNRRPGPNEPAFLIDVIAAVAKARQEDPAHVATLTALNARQLFDLPCS
jgi:TatD DNase family protein